MKASELINLLKKLVNDQGDIDVLYESDGRFREFNSMYFVPYGADKTKHFFLLTDRAKEQQP